MTALQGLLADEETKTLLSMFLLASAQKNLSMCSFRLFGVEKPKEEEVWSTEVTDEDLENAVEDEFGVKYSKDWKRLLKAPESLSGKYTIRKGVKVIGNSAFWLCSSLTNINIPNSVTNIGYEAFFLCRSLTKINIPNGVTNIGDIAFSGCDSLTKIKIPSSVVYMNGYTFLGWNGDLYNESKAFVYERQVLFNKDKTTLIAYRSKKTSYIIPNSVTNIENYAFSGCKSLTSINIPNSVTNIEDSAFSGCDSLTNINIPNSVTNVEDSAFSWCKSLTNINIPDSVTNIGDYAFSDCI